MYVLALCLSFRVAQPPHLHTGRTSWPRLTVRDPPFAVDIAVAAAACKAWLTVWEMFKPID